MIAQVGAEPAGQVAAGAHVGIDEEQVVAARRGRAFVGGDAKAAVAAALQQSRAVESLQPFATTVRGGIIDNDRFILDAAVASQGGKAALDPVGRVIADDDNGNVHAPSIARAASATGRGRINGQCLARRLLPGIARRLRQPELFQLLP